MYMILLWCFWGLVWRKINPGGFSLIRCFYLQNRKRTLTVRPTKLLERSHTAIYSSIRLSFYVSLYPSIHVSKNECKSFWSDGSSYILGKYVMNSEQNCFFRFLKWIPRNRTICLFIGFIHIKEHFCSLPRKSSQKAKVGYSDHSTSKNIRAWCTFQHFFQNLTTNCYRFPRRWNPNLLSDFQNYNSCIWFHIVLAQ